MESPNNHPVDSFSNAASPAPVILRRSELLNLPVMDRSEMETAGRIERLWMYPQAHRVLGIVCKPGGLFNKQRRVYKLPQLDSLGQGNLWVNGPAQETTAEQLQQLQSLMDHEVWVDGGDRLGQIIDCLFNRKTGEITQYLLADNRWRRLLDNPLTLPPSDVLSFGNGRALVAPKTLARLGRERPSLKQTWDQVREQARAEYDQVSQHTGEQVRHWGQGAKSLKQRLANQAESLGQQAAERAKRLREQAQELTQELGQDLTQELGQRGEALGEQGQGLGSRVGEHYHQLQRRAREFVEELPPLELGGPVPDDRRNRRDRPGAPQGWARADESPDGADPRAFDPDIDREFDEVTWIDEAGELPPARSSPRERAYRHRRDRAPETPWLESPPPSQPVPNEPAQSGPDSPAPSRDNPWGYADQATESDWAAFDLAFGPGSQSPAAIPPPAPATAETAPRTEGDSATDSMAEPIEEPREDWVPEPDRYGTGLIAPEDLDSDDPWI